MKKAGILGGGQLGRMLLQAAANYPVETYVLENDPECPAAHLCHHFTKGDITNEEAVYNFGKQLDVLTIEIENVNTSALERLEKEGVTIIPRPSVLKTIRNKILQKEFYKAHEIFTSPFAVTTQKNDISNYPELFPAAHKMAVGGYDGKGVQLLDNSSETEIAFDGPAILEKAVKISKEIAVIVAVNNPGDSVLYPIVEMVFDNVLNLVNHQIAPAELPEKVKWKAEALALKTVQAFRSPGIFAVECFVDYEENVFVNETAPRVHNSGHHTIEGSFSSQFDMTWRILLDYPLGNPDLIKPAAMVNIIGAPGHSGPVKYQGLQDVLAMDNTFVHLYGKKLTKPGRKMGHVTIISDDKIDLLRKCKLIRHTLLAES